MIHKTIGRLILDLSDSKSVLIKLKRAPRHLNAPEVWDRIKVLGDKKSRPMMACLVRLCALGVSDPVLLQIASHYSVHHNKIDNPFAYYSKNGAATVARLVEVQDGDHESVKADTEAWLKSLRQC